MQSEKHLSTHICSKQIRTFAFLASLLSHYPVLILIHECMYPVQCPLIYTEINHLILEFVNLCNLCLIIIMFHN